MPRRRATSDLVLAVVMAAIAVLALAVWIPADVETGMIEKFRRQTFLGDAFIPALAAGGVLVSSVILIIGHFFRPPADETEPGRLDSQALGFFAVLAGIVAVSLLLIFYAGPVAVALFADEGATYRVLRDTAPYKYVGFVLGGFTMIFGTISLIEGRILARRALVALAGIALLLLVFDVPFDNLLLPPNGDY